MASRSLAATRAVKMVRSATEERLQPNLEAMAEIARIATVNSNLKGKK